MTRLPALLLLVACAPLPLPPPHPHLATRPARTSAVAAHPHSTLQRVSDGHYRSADDRFDVVWSPDRDAWLIFVDGDTEPACAAGWRHQ